MANEPIVNLPNLYLDNMQIAWVSNTTMSVQAGQCRDATNVYDIVINAPLVLNMAVHGANGLDTGSIAASSLYYIYAIMDVSGFNSPAVMASLSATPVMPYGYGASRVIGYMMSDVSSHLIAGYWSGNHNDRKWTYDAPVATAITAGAATAYTAVTLANLAPAIDQMVMQIQSVLTPGAAGRAVFLQGANSTGDAVKNVGQVTSVVLENIDDVLAQLVAGVPKINYKVSNAGDAVALNVAGFKVSL